MTDCREFLCEAGVPAGVNTDGLITEVQLVPFGKHQTDKGAFVLDAEAAARVMEAYSEKKSQMAVDYEHQGLTGAEAPAAGWIRRLIDRGREGLWAEVRWTGRARAYLAHREYRYISPVFLKEEGSGRVVRLLGAGLTNSPAIDGMVPLVNKEGVFNPQPNKKNQKEEAGMQRLLRELGLGSDAKVEDAAVEVVALKAKVEAAQERPASKEVLEALGLNEEAKRSEVMGTVLAMKKGHELAGELGVRIEELLTKLRDTDAGAMVAQAMREGKLTPAQEGWATEFAARDPEGFSTFAAKAPSVIAFGEAGRAAVSHASAGGALDAVQREVNSLTGITDEMFLRHNR